MRYLPYLIIFRHLKVQATEKSFAETREKAKKLADDDQKKKTKDLPGHRQNQKSLGHRPIASSAKPFSRPSNSLAPRSSDGHGKVTLLQGEERRDPLTLDFRSLQ